jgi:translocation and assembly module TamB
MDTPTPADQAPPPGTVPEAAPPAAGPTPAAAPPVRRQRWPHAVGLLTFVAAALVLPALGGWALLTRPAAVPALLGLVPGLKAQGVQGTLASGDLRIAQLDWALPAKAGRLQIDELAVSGLALQRAPHAGAWAALHWQRLQAKAVRYTSGPPSPDPLKPPTDLRLPLVLVQLPVAIGSLQIDALPPLSSLQARLSVGAVQGSQHRLDGLDLVVEQVRVRGDLAIATQAPLPVNARLQAQADAPPAWQATLQADGPLARLHLQARLSGNPSNPGQPGSAPAQNAARTALAAAPSLLADATVLPFAAWPLAALDLSTHALDLAALSPRLPQTAIDASASVQTQGLNQPVAMQATLDNRLPGAWDSGRVPVRRLQLALRGEVQHPDQLSLDRFDLQLGDSSGPAGQARGQGRWHGDTLSLDITLDGLQPARLHRHAAALDIAGPLALQFTGLPRPAHSAAAGAASPASASGPATTASAAGATAAPKLALQATLAGRALDGSGLPVKLTVAAELSTKRLLISRAEASAGTAQAQLTLDAQAQAAGAWKLLADARLSNFDPVPWWRGADGSAWRRGPHRLNADGHADLLWRGLPADGRLYDRLLLAIDGDARLGLRDSLLAGVPLAGQWQLHSQGKGLQVSADTTLGGNRLQLAGVGGGAPADDRWQLDLQAPTLANLAPLGQVLAEIDPDLAAGWPSAGQVTAALQVQGRWPAMRTQGELTSQGLRTGAASLQQVAASWRTGDDVDAPLSLQFEAQGLRAGGQTVDRLQASASGSLKRHTLRFAADSPLKPPAWTENLLGSTGSGSRFEGEARGAWVPAEAGAGGGNWRLSELTVKGGARDGRSPGRTVSRPWLAASGLAGELRLDRDGQPQAMVLQPGRVQLLTTALNWRALSWQAGSDGGGGAGAGGTLPRLTVQAELETVDVAGLLARAQPTMGWGGNLTLSGRIDIRAADKLDADIVFERGGGDLTLTDDLGGVQTLGISDIRLALGVHDGLWQFAQGLAGRSIGEMAGAQVLRSTPERRWPAPDSPLQGVIESRVANLGIWGAWVPPGWHLSGALHTTASVAGTASAPELRGEMRGNGLVLRNVLQGIHLSDGDLAINLGGDKATIERLVFKGGDGQLSVTGGATLGSTPALAVVLAADHFRLLGRIDRRIVTSGKASLQLDATRLAVDGRFAIDEGLIDISQSDAPALDDDVQVKRSAPGTSPGASAASAPTTRPVPTVAGSRDADAADRSNAATPPPVMRQAQVAVVVNLGDKLRLRGRGVDTLLRGELSASTPGGKLALVGTVRGAGGNFAAYGQKLDITRGEVVFAGAADNPRLDVRATRPNLDVVVGVSVTGSALNPRVRLFSEPELADIDKLSWLVLGRSPDGLGRTDTALLQRAALALLSGDGKAPTDELINALGLTDFSVRQTEGTVRETVVSLGRQLSRRWYLGYERSVNATTGTWQLVYRVAQRFTLRAQSGAENALDAIWSWRW